ncbi:MAG: hypothetical protein QM696_07090 [Steroidobacteraceae bacterium]
MKRPHHDFMHRAASLLWCAVLAAASPLSIGAAPGKPGSPDSLAGIWQSIPDGKVLPGGMKNSGSPSEIVTLPGATKPVKGEAGQQDPYKLCQAVGAFRMMALPDIRMEFVPAPGRLVMLFEDISHGHMRSLYTDRSTHPADYQPRYAFQGDSIAHWEGSTLVVDTTGFNQRTWLNDSTIASDALHLVERIRPLPDGRHLEYRMTATDSKSLAKPYSYVRYFQRSDAPIEDDSCHIENSWNPGA